MTTAAERRARIADAAISTLAKEGMRGLTHRAVDQAAELPQGSCSYYFRTRQALLEATVARLFELDTAALTPVSPMPEQFDLDLLVDLMTGFVERAATVDRENLIARYELSLEATRRPELRATLVDIGERYRQLAISVLAAVGAPDPERQGRAMVAFVDGLMFDQIAGAGARTLDTTAVRQSMRDLLRAILDSPR